MCYTASMMRECLKNMRELGGACECDLGSLVSYNPAHYPVLRAYLAVVVRRRDYLPRPVRNMLAPVRDMLAVILYETAHPRGHVGRLIGRKMPRGPQLDPWGKSYGLPGPLREYTSSVCSLHRLSMANKSDGPEADGLRDEMDRMWEALTSEQQKIASRLMADLNQVRRAWASQKPA